MGQCFAGRKKDAVKKNSISKPVVKDEGTKVRKTLSMRCRVCRKYNEEDAFFCERCGDENLEKMQVFDRSTLYRMQKSISSDNFQTPPLLDAGSASFDLPDLNTVGAPPIEEKRRPRTITSVPKTKISDEAKEINEIRKQLPPRLAKTHDIVNVFIPIWECGIGLEKIDDFFRVRNIEENSLAQTLMNIEINDILYMIDDQKLETMELLETSTPCDAVFLRHKP